MSTTLEQNQYGFDRNSRRTWQKRPLTYAQDQQYNYDTLSQVAAAARGSLNLNMTAISGIPAIAESWDYDPTGNWRGYHAAANGSTTLDQHRVHDRGNRMTQIEANPSNMLLDRAGRMRQMAPDAGGDWDGTLELTWDAWSRITSVKNNGEVVGNYAYDGTHRRISRGVDGETRYSYYNDAWRPVEERKDAETTASISYLWGVRFRDDLARRDGAVGGTTLNETRYVLMDYFNPAAITDESGEVKERYAFNAFGLRTILNPDFTKRSNSECGLEFAFQGQFLDEESGLMNYGYRYYSPPLGRWTCKDPIEERGGTNLYKMAHNMPNNLVDAYGLETKGDAPSPWGDSPGRCLRCAANDPAKPGEPDEPSLSKPKTGPLDNKTISCASMREALKARGAYEPDLRKNEGCECDKNGKKGYLSVFWVYKVKGGGPGDFQYHFFRDDGSGNNFYDNDRTVGSRSKLANELKEMQEDMGPTFSVCPAICFPEGGIDVG